MVLTYIKECWRDETKGFIRVIQQILGSQRLLRAIFFNLMLVGLICAPLFYAN